MDDTEDISGIVIIAAICFEVTISIDVLWQAFLERAQQDYIVMLPCNRNCYLIEVGQVFFQNFVWLHLSGKRIIMIRGSNGTIGSLLFHFLVMY